MNISCSIFVSVCVLCLNPDVVVFVLAASPSMKAEQPYQAKEVDSKHKDEVLLNVIRPDYERPAAPPPMEPLYNPKDDGKVQGKHKLTLKSMYN